jgi:hypothetical protein
MIYHSAKSLVGCRVNLHFGDGSSLVYVLVKRIVKTAYSYDLICEANSSQFTIPIESIVGATKVHTGLVEVSFW